MLRRLLPLLAVSALLAPVGCAVQGSSDVAADGTRETESVRCAAGSTVEGVDVSKWDGTIDWSQVAASGKVFAIARIGDGTYVDPTFDTNWAAIKDAGLIRGAYQFFRPADDPSQLADIVVSKVGMLDADDLPVTVDVEVADGVSPSTYASRLQTWIDRVTAGTGKTPIVYTGKYFWNDNVKSTAERGNPLWIAQYGPVCPDLPSPWTDWAFFQYSEKGSVPGISSAVDLDRFNGTRDDLVAFANGGTASAPTDPGTGAGTGTGSGSGSGGTPTPPPPNGCWSHTLNQEVPLNTCVQSASDGNWYQCDGDNQWVDRWSDPNACSSEHPLP